MRERLTARFLAWIHLNNQVPSLPGEEGIRIEKPSLKIYQLEIFKWSLTQLGLAVFLLFVVLNGTTVWDYFNLGFIDRVQQAFNENVAYRFFEPDHWHLGVIIVTSIAYVLEAILSFIPVWMRLGHQTRWYLIGEHAVGTREGWWTVHEKVSPWHKIQSVRMRSGPLQNLLGVGDIELRAAGGGDLSWENKETRSKKMIVFHDVDRPEEMVDLLRKRLIDTNRRDERETTDGVALEAAGVRRILEEVCALERLVVPGKSNESH